MEWIDIEWPLILSGIQHFLFHPIQFSSQYHSIYNHEFFFNCQDWSNFTFLMLIGINKTHLFLRNKSIYHNHSYNRVQDILLKSFRTFLLISHKRKMTNIISLPYFNNYSHCVVCDMRRAYTGRRLGNTVNTSHNGMNESVAWAPECLGNVHPQSVP